MTISLLYSLYKNYPNVSTDSRNIPKNCLFFALKGDKFDANSFAKEALLKGAKYVIVDNPKVAENNSFIVVENVLKTLQELAHFHRKQLKIPVIALTGSNGKTTTKELLNAVLCQKFKTVATQGNLNNHIGVPLTLLKIQESTEIALIEMGANHLGDITELCAIAQPTHGVLTSIGKAHLEGFGGLEGVKKTKGELFDYLDKNKGLFFVNTNSKEIIEIAERFPKATQKKYPSLEFELIQEIPTIIYQRKGENSIHTTSLSGKYNFENILTALEIGNYFGVEKAKADEAISNYNPENNRSQWIKTPKNHVFLDAYNANPTSMKLALESFFQLKHTNKVVILGDMRELGEYSESEHELLGKLVHHFNFQTVIYFGEEIKPALKHTPKAYYFSDKFSLHNWLQDNPLENTQIFIKGSRGTSLESVLPFL